MSDKCFGYLEEINLIIISIVVGYIVVRKVIIFISVFVFLMY